MQTSSIPRRQFFRLLGAGALLGTVGTASASEGRYIVGTRSRAARREAQRRARSVRHVLDFGAYGSAVAGTFPEAALRGLSRRPDVDYIEEDGLMYAISIEASSGTELGYSWGVDRIDAEKTGTSTGSGSKIAILDTGIDYNHPDLQSNYAGGATYVDDTADAMDDNGHGTHCAGIAAAVGNGGGVIGTAPEASLYGVKVLGASGSGSYSDIAAGLNWTWQDGNDIDVASMSLGGGRGTTTLERACDSARDAGVFVVAAAGNDGRGRLSYPAKYDSVVAVSASDKQDRIASWSNTGDGLDHAAPGVGITSTVPPGLGGRYEFEMDGATYATWSGTSMACPHVAGVAGLVMAGDAMLGQDARTLLAATAEDVDEDGYDKSYGYGLVDAEAAVAGSSGGTDDGGTTEDTTAPSDPANLTGTATGENSADLSWTGSTDDSGTVAYYTVYRDGAFELETTGTTASVTGLTAGTGYSFHVTATDGSGNESGASNTATVTTDTASGGTSTPVIDSFDVVSGNPNNPHADVEMSWQVSGSPDTVTLELYRGTDTTGTLIDSWPVGASGSRTYQEKFSSGAYTARLHAMNSAGDDEETRTVTA